MVSWLRYPLVSVADVVGQRLLLLTEAVEVSMTAGMVVRQFVTAMWRIAVVCGPRTARVTLGPTTRLATTKSGHNSPLSFDLYQKTMPVTPYPWLLPRALRCALGKYKQRGSFSRAK